MASETFIQPAIPHFDGHYDHWSMLMEQFSSVVSEGITRPAAGTMTNAQKTRVRRAKVERSQSKDYLFQAIDRTILETILCKDTSKQIWDSLKKKYEGSNRTKRQQLQALRFEFETLRMKSGETVSDFFLKNNVDCQQDSDSW
ncbi:Retrovirus-related Pol polyprotein from transposon TNT 1-94 [Gossypium australe]|uniref:Retrovirus-related Pol polyprotein from transposon TNT 1-94 n=1 Tax=Gossypium australe TaxID=47621 RepID=A0A5B6WCW1_9ROSI|nr:Retrovirus-related Pol polyprotein from transposon TNT 1-94 [Gossypium australe]